MSELIEYRVRPVTRYIVTRFESHDHPDGRSGGGSRPLGEFDSADTAYEVGYALCKAEHDRLGWPPGDERIQYPRDPRIAPQSSRPTADLVAAGADNIATPGSLTA